MVRQLLEESKTQYIDILAMKRVVREVFYPKNIENSEFIFDSSSSDDAFIPETLKNSAKEEMDVSVVDLRIKAALDAADEESFIPVANDPVLQNLSMAKEVFFPEEKADEEPKGLLGYYSELEQLTNECKSALESDRVIHSKKTFNQLRLQVLRTDLPEHDQKVYHKILEDLFNEIHLKQLEAEAIKRLSAK